MKINIVILASVVTAFFGVVWQFTAFFISLKAGLIVLAIGCSILILMLLYIIIKNRDKF
jgi:hypothetical protein